MSLCKSCQAVCLFILGIALLPVISWSQTGPDPKLIEGAKKEGQLVYYTTMTLDQSKQTVDRFEQGHPFSDRRRTAIEQDFHGVPRREA